MFENNERVVLLFSTSILFISHLQILTWYKSRIGLEGL